jgi:hypothetical protein
LDDDGRQDIRLRSKRSAVEEHGSITYAYTVSQRVTKTPGGLKHTIQMTPKEKMDTER